MEWSGKREDTNKRQGIQRQVGGLEEAELERLDQQEMKR